LHVTVADTRRPGPGDAGATSGTIQEAAAKEIVILAVPINRLRGVLRTIAPFVRPGALIIDVCSVKELPVRWMKSHLPPHVSILGTHPLFGPDSAPMSVKGKWIIFTPVRISKPRLLHVHAFCRKIGLRTDTMTPAAHDRLMARSLFLAQFVGRASFRMGLTVPDARTGSYDQLLALAGTAGRDTPELFRDMYRFNRFARSVPKQFASSVEKTKKSLY
jgi:prephenate dehydrogenase